MGAALRHVSVRHHYSIEFPPMEWDHASKGVHGSLTSDCSTFYNIRSERRPARRNSLRFSGVRGTIPLGNHDVIYYEMHVFLVSFICDHSWARLGELGLASEAALSSSSERHPVYKQNKDGLSIRLDMDERRKMLCIKASTGKKVLQPEGIELRIPTDKNSHHALGFLFIGPKGKIHVINALTFSVLWKCHVQVKEPLWPYIGIRDCKGKRLCCMHLHSKMDPEKCPEKITFLQDLVRKKGLCPMVSFSGD